MGHRRDRPTRLPSRLPSSATTPAAASTSAAAALGATAVAVSMDVQSTVANAGPSATEATASGLTVATPAAPPATSTYNRTGASASTRGARMQLQMLAPPIPSAGKGNRTGKLRHQQESRSSLVSGRPAVLGMGLALPAISFTRRSPAVLPLAEMALERPQEAPVEVIDGIGAAAGTGVTGPRIPVGREDVA
ncbi:hypothetical protein Vretimale_2481 [Volvox reticuliferus]|uniref:Uncharacterized protein n=1 Tax=Volvox reticuliferus TaxID=1737510 RepID=A0A8J4D7V4_9CHLO|nr:hypothetical protein Vretifemale_4886 [Volvox reticuliferus]GIL96853.1 hypothetical protein Vretimale_2481 [Volvox reticuliferus]